MYNPFKKDDSKGGDKLFVCPWCGFKFKQYIRTSSSNGKNSSGTNQVVCPRCKAFLKSDSGVD